MTFSVGERLYIWHDVQLTWLDIWPNANLGLQAHVGGWGYIWLKGRLLTVVQNLAMRCLYQEEDGTSGLCNQGCHTHGHKMSLPGERVRLTLCVISSQSASQLQLASQPAMWQNINLSGFGLVRWWQEDREPNHIGPQSRVAALWLVPLGEWPTWPRLGKWHKVSSEASLYTIGTTFMGLFAVLYLHHLITYSCMKCREMWHRLLSLQTNLLVSFHLQSDVLLHQGTTFNELLLSSQIRNAMEKSLTKGQPKVVTHLATKYLSWGARGRYIWPKVSLPKVENLAIKRLNIGGRGGRGAGDGVGDIWLKIILPKVVPNLATRCLYSGYLWSKVSLTWSSTTLGH